jgi:glycosyltransferase involved in cell wall biosynthesis
MSKTAGRGFERWLLEKADVVACLSREGAEATEKAYGLNRQVIDVRHVSDPSEPSAAERMIFVPGPVRPAVAIEIVESAAGVGMPVAFGYFDPPDRDELVAQRARVVGVQLEPNNGVLTQSELSSVYQRAAIVLHWRSLPKNGSLASSGPLIDALANGCVVVTNTPRGTRQVLEESGSAFLLGREPGKLASTLRFLADDPDELARLSTRARTFAQSKLSCESVAAAVAAAMTSAATRE